MNNYSYYSVFFYIVKEILKFRTENLCEMRGKIIMTGELFDFLYLYHQESENRRMKA